MTEEGLRLLRSWVAVAVVNAMSDEEVRRYLTDADYNERVKDAVYRAGLELERIVIPVVEGR